MKTIYFIRHGQASVNSKVYDQLSILGQRQCFALGEYVYNRSMPDKIYSGSMKRHIQSFEHFQKGCSINLASHVIDVELNEFDHVDVVKRYKPQWHKIESLSEVLSEFESPKIFFKEVFSPAIFSWVNGDSNGYSESFDNFIARCINSLKAIYCNSGDSKDLYVFTSGGVISAILQYVLRLPKEQFFALNSQLVNSSVTKIFASSNGFSMDCFNNYSHLENNTTKLVTRI